MKNVTSKECEATPASKTTSSVLNPGGNKSQASPGNIACAETEIYLHRILFVTIKTPKNRNECIMTDINWDYLKQTSIYVNLITNMNFSESYTLFF